MRIKLINENNNNFGFEVFGIFKIKELQRIMRVKKIEQKLRFQRE